MEVLFKVPKKSKFPNIIVFGNASKAFKRGVRKAGERLRSGYRSLLRENVWARYERVAAKGWRASEKLLSWDYAIILGQALYECLSESTRSFIPTSDFTLLPEQPGTIKVKVRELVAEVTPSGRAYCVPNSTVEISGERKVVSFSQHAISRLKGRVTALPDSFVGKTSLCAVVYGESGIFFRPEHLGGDASAAFSIWQEVDEDGQRAESWSHYVAEHILGSPPAKDACLLLGYCPSDMFGALIRARTFLIPGMRGTPENSWYLLLYGEKARARLEEAVEMHDLQNVKMTEINGVAYADPHWDFGVLREFHAVFPQVIQQRELFEKS